MKIQPTEPVTIAEINQATTQHVCAVNYAVAIRAMNRLIQLSPTEQEREEWRTTLKQIQ